jgi:hypothetical protein
VIITKLRTWKIMDWSFPIPVTSIKPILFLVTLLLTLAPLSAQASCPPGNPEWISYIRRDNNRCEGKRDGRDASGNLSLVSLATTNPGNQSCKTG